MNRAAAVLILAFLAIVGPVILSGAGGTSEAKDETRFHLPVIEQFADQLPAPDLRDYPSATGPGVHLPLAVLRRAGVEDVRGLRAANALWGLGLLLVVWRVAAGRTDPWTGLLLTAPLAASSYVLGSAMWITTDDAGLCLAALAVASALGAGDRTRSPAPSPRRLALGGVASAAGAFVRQLHLWTAGVVALAAVHAILTRRAGDGEGARPWNAATIALVAGSVVLPFAVIGALAWAWGGLVPPSLADVHQRGLRWATPVMALALVGAFGSFHAPVLLDRSRVFATAPLVAAAATFLLAMVPATNFDEEAGRWGGAVWLVVKALPAPGDRSLVLVAGAAVGAFWLAHAWRGIVAAGRGREGLVLAVAGLGWTAAHLVNSETWQRYTEPPVLILLAWASALVLCGRRPRGWWLGPAALLAVQLGLLVVTLVRPLLDGTP